MENGPITIVALGDSVTHGALWFDEIDYDTVYHRLLAQKISARRNYVPVNVINAAVGGTTAKDALARLERDVVAHRPDLVTVCFGLNDVNQPIETFGDSLREVIRRCVATGADVIYMTPNMLNTYVTDDTPEMYRNYAAVTAEYQNGGRMDRYMAAACRIAREEGAQVCDCYALWKEMAARGEDTTRMLVNRINHPAREMHRLFADALYRMLFPEDGTEGTAESTMYR